MTGLAVLGLIVAALVLLDIAALGWGADSRFGADEIRGSSTRSI